MTYFCKSTSFLFKGIIGYGKFMKLTRNLKTYSESEIAQQRLKVIKFSQKYSVKAACEAFNISKSTAYLWKKTLRDSGGKLISLIPKSTRPHHVRQMITDPEIISFIRKLRDEHPRLGKEKVKPLLDQFCEEAKIKSISESTIGKVIKKHKLFFFSTGRIYHNPNSGWATRKRKKRLRVRYAPKPKDFGYIQMDSVVKFVDGVKRYVISAIDVKLKYSFSLCYKNSSSKSALDLFQKFEKVYPFAIKKVQTDNGSEFLGKFENYLEKKGIAHYFIYPRCPRINGCVERYQRSLQEEFLDHHLELIYEPKLLNDKLIEYLIFYNCQRAHQTLGLKSPIDYLLSNGYLSKMYVTSTYTLTTSTPIIIMRSVLDTICTFPTVFVIRK